MKLTTKTARLIAREVANEMALSIQKRLEALTESSTAEKAIRRTALRMAEALNAAPDKTLTKTALRHAIPNCNAWFNPTLDRLLDAGDIRSQYAPFGDDRADRRVTMITLMRHPGELHALATDVQADII